MSIQTLSNTGDTETNHPHLAKQLCRLETLSRLRQVACKWRSATTETKRVQRKCTVTYSSTLGLLMSHSSNEYGIHFIFNSTAMQLCVSGESILIGQTNGHARPVVRLFRLLSFESPDLLPWSRIRVGASKDGNAVGQTSTFDWGQFVNCFLVHHVIDSL